MSRLRTFGKGAIFLLAQVVTGGVTYWACRPPAPRLVLDPGEKIGVVVTGPGQVEATSRGLSVEGSYELVRLPPDVAAVGS